ncbi:MAG: pyruvate:ferredoxin (flavodoxin) oxidoreductase, partial [Puniceicoccales bacterium]|nr:pyruvate:ferredoxin (flavodoxin) oxidoreductase [Puniceicoccales bacterium]
MTRVGSKQVTDANQAVADVAYRMSEVVAIYPITPSSPMAEWCDEWSADGRKNLWNVVPEMVQMQSEGGVAGAVHGALQGGVLTTTFTASQGLLLMIPNLYKIAGEFLPFCMHVSARTVATHALSIFGDHSDVMACRQTGFAMLASGSVQEAHDMAAVAHALTLESRIPFMHFFDGFRTSHEINTYQRLDDETLKALVNEECLREFRRRALTPDRPTVRGTAQNPDVFFQGRERGNLLYQALYGMVKEKMALLEKWTGRSYRPYEYVGSPEADRVIVVMGSAGEVVEQAVHELSRMGQSVGVVKVRLYRPFENVKDFLTLIPSSVRRVAVLDRTKEPGAVAEPLCQDVQAVFAKGQREGWIRSIPVIVGGRYGLSSKEFDPAMAMAVFESLNSDSPKHSFTVGIEDDLTETSLNVEREVCTEKDEVFRAIFYGLGSDGTVGANKNTVKIVGQETDRFVQAYFVYDSKKSGAMTVSHLRFGPSPIRAPYLIREAHFVACHQFPFLDRYDVLEVLKPGGVFLLNAPFPKEKVWDALPEEVQRTLLEKRPKFYAIDAYRVARETCMGTRINTVMQTCFFALSGILPKEEAIGHIKKAIEKSYGKKGEAVVRQNFLAVDAALDNLLAIDIPITVTAKRKCFRLPMEGAPEFVRKTTRAILDQKGDRLPVSALPLDGTWPTATTQWEKRNIALELPEWDPEGCIQCNRCILICPHACLRAKYFSEDRLATAPASFRTAKFRSQERTDYRIQVSPEDCTGCSLCVAACPGKSKTRPTEKILRMVLKEKIFEEEKVNFTFFERLPWPKATEVRDVKNVSFRRPLFEYSGACAGCGETPYIKLLTQLFGDRLLMANATGCSSIYGGNLPTTPYGQNEEGRGPAWANSLFEDNAEFGLGLWVSMDKKMQMAKDLLKTLAPMVGDSLVNDLLAADVSTEEEVARQRDRVSELKKILGTLEHPESQNLLVLADF